VVAEQCGNLRGTRLAEPVAVLEAAGQEAVKLEPARSAWRLQKKTMTTQPTYTPRQIHPVMRPTVLTLVN
jgi:hypothetical protein